MYWRARDLRKGIEYFVQSIWFGNDLSLAKPFGKVASRTARQKGKRDSSVYQGIGNRKRTIIPMQVDIEQGAVEWVFFNALERLVDGGGADYLVALLRERDLEIHDQE